MIALEVFTNVIRAENGVGSINIGMRKQGYHYLQIIVLKKNSSEPTSKTGESSEGYLVKVQTSKGSNFLMCFK